jgi:hypothetical protein
MLKNHLLPLACLALLACAPSPQQVADGPDPLQALGSPALSSRYTVEFWARELHTKCSLWQRATSFCKERDPAVFPNCHAVAVASFWESPPAFPRPRLTLDGLLAPPAPPAGLFSPAIPDAPDAPARPAAPTGPASPVSPATPASPAPAPRDSTRGGRP